MEEYIIYVTDTETTGLIPGVNEIIEVSSFRFCLNDDTKSEQKNWLIRAMNPDTIEESALSTNGHKREDILHQTKYGKENYILPSNFVPEYDAWVSSDDMSAHDRVFCGQNPMFDFNHMMEMWKKYESFDTFPFLIDYDALIQDTKTLALTLDIALGRKRDRYGLSALVKSFGVKKLKAHRADADTQMTKDLYLKIIEAIRQAAKEHFDD
jgi:DNA polymerase III alpha subunit (gram-positive type)